MAFKQQQNNLCKPTLAPVEFIRRIVNSSLVISCSLHGIILAEAYGVPAIFLRAGHTEKAFKYDDYYQGTGRKEYLSAASVDEALLMPAPRPPDFSNQQRSLFDAFPFDLWPD
jgi:pyruvyltransferase